MEFRPSLEFHPGAPYASQPVQSAQPAQAGNLSAGENPVQGGQWLPVDQSHHGGIPYGGMSHGNIVHGNMSHAGMSHGSMPNGSMSHGGMSHGSIPQGSLAHGGMPPGGIHHGNISHTNVNQGGISLWPHQQPGVVSAGRQFSLHGQERPYYGAAPFSYSHQQVNHPSAVHPPPGSYITRMNPSAHGYEVPYTPSRNSVIGQAQMVNRVGSYHFQHPQAIYNTPPSENTDPRGQKQQQRSKYSATKTHESQSNNVNGSVPASPTPMPGSGGKRLARRQQRTADYHNGPSLQAPSPFFNGGDSVGGNGQSSYSEADQHGNRVDYEDEQEQKRERIKAKVEQEFALLESTPYEAKMERWMDFEEDEFCPV